MEMTKEEALEQLECADGLELVNDEYLYKGLSVAVDCIEKILTIEQIISEYKNCTDAWQGQDEGFVLGRIEEVLNDIR